MTQSSTNFAKLLESFFIQRLMKQRQVSPHTISSYRDSFRLLLQYGQKRLHKSPSKFELSDIDASLISSFLEHMEKDHVFLLVALQTGLRLSELISLEHTDIVLGTSNYLRVIGKGRKQRATPLTKETAKILKKWMEDSDAESVILFPSTRGNRLSPDAVQCLLSKHALAASRVCPSLQGKRVTPHMMRHSCAMELLQAGIDRSMIALWLGHESVETTQIYLHANLTLKEEILAKTQMVKGKRGRFKPDDELLAFLSSL